MTISRREIEDMYLGRFGKLPPCHECISLELQAEWWLQCVEENDPRGPIERGYEAVMDELPEGAVL